MLTGTLRHGRKHREAVKKVTNADWRNIERAADVFYRDEVLRWTPEEQAALKERGRAPLVFNVIGKAGSGGGPLRALVDPANGTVVGWGQVPGLSDADWERMTGRDRSERDALQHEPNRRWMSGEEFAQEMNSPLSPEHR